MADQFGMELSGIPAELQAEYLGLKNRQALEKALMERALQPSGGARQAGRFMVAPHPLEAIGKVALGYASMKGSEETNRRQADLSGRYQQKVADALAGFQRAAQGTPATSEPIIDELANQGEGAPATINAPAVKGDPRKAVMDAMMNPLLQRNPALPTVAKMMIAEDAPYTLPQGAQRRDAKGGIIAENPPEFRPPNPQPPSNLARLLEERSKLPDGDPRIAAYNNAIRKESEIAKQIVPPVVRIDTSGTKKQPTTEGTKATDRAFSKDYVAWKANGGIANVEQDLQKLDAALSALESGRTISGPVTGLIPDALKSFVNPESKQVRDDIGAVVQKSLRAILGGQFAMREGEQLLKRSYDESLDEKTNATRLRLLIDNLRKAAQAKESAAEYFEENGTLDGFKGPSPTAIINAQQKTPQSSSGVIGPKKQKVDVRSEADKILGIK